MAGGRYAAVVACMVCYGDDGILTRAWRVRVGVESDRYLCRRGHTFAMDWPEPATEPQWPPPDLTGDPAEQVPHSRPTRGFWGWVCRRGRRRAG